MALCCSVGRTAVYTTRLQEGKKKRISHSPHRTYPLLFFICPVPHGCKMMTQMSYIKEPKKVKIKK